MEKLISAAQRSRLLWKELGQLQSPGESRDSAFIRWYLQVRLGTLEKSVRLTDGPGDGGIDAIQYPARGDKDVVIVQAFFADPRKNQGIKKKKLAQ